MQKLKIPITTFMIATDPYLQRFVQEFTETNNGKAFLQHSTGWAPLYLKILRAEKEKTVY